MQLEVLSAIIIIIINTVETNLMSNWISVRKGDYVTLLFIPQILYK